MTDEPLNESDNDNPDPKQAGQKKQPAQDAGGDNNSEDTNENFGANSSTSSEEDVQTEQATEDASADAGDVSEELTKVKDQLLRTVAEMENVRRRAQRDVENAHKFAVEKLLGDLLPVVDSLEKAEEAAKATDNAVSMAEGISLSLKLFVGTLEKAGVAMIDPLGEPFDPQLHEAMAMVPNPDAEPNSVMDVMQRGYTLNGRLVRAAKVIVVKGD